MPRTIGQPLRRKEDLRLITGSGRYSDDVSLPGQAYAHVLRSPHAHARIRSIDTAAARAMPGVLAVLTGADVVADGLKEVPHTPIPIEAAGRHPADQPGRLGARLRAAGAPADRPGPLRRPAGGDGGGGKHRGRQGCGRARHGGLRAAAGGDRNAGARPSRTSRLYDHTANVCIDADVGDVEATKAAFARAAHVAKFETWVQRVTGVPLDARAAVGVYDPATNKHTLHAGSGGVVRQKHELADILGVPGRRAGRVRRRRRQLRHPQRILSRSSRWWCGRRNASAAR